MNHLWTPWRLKYIQQHAQPTRCIFCAALGEDDGPQNLVVARGKLAFVILNRYPYSSGHLMVVPNEHQPSIEALSADTRSEMMELVNHAMGILREVYRPEAFNLGANIGAAAGAGIAEHVHIHVVPRWGGDTNFMTAVGETRVIPEELDTAYQRIRQAWNHNHTF